MLNPIPAIIASLHAQPFVQMPRYEGLIKHYLEELANAQAIYVGKLRPDEAKQFSAQCDATWDALSQKPPHFASERNPESARAANALFAIFIETALIPRGGRVGLLRTKLITSIDELLRSNQYLEGRVEMNGMTVDDVPVDESGFHHIFRSYEHVLDAAKAKTSVGIFAGGRGLG